MAEVVSGEEGIEKMRAPPVDRLCVGMRGSWAYRKQGDGQILIDSSSTAAFLADGAPIPPSTYPRRTGVTRLEQSWQHARALLTARAFIHQLHARLQSRDPRP